jgi:hypothetical protein
LGDFREKLLPRNENVPESATNPGGNCVQEGKYPAFWGISGRNYCGGMKMSWKAPQNREEIVYRRANILIPGGFPGETSAAERKCPGKRHKTERNCHQGATKKPPEQFQGPDIRML